MPHHERDDRPLLLGERQEVRRKLVQPLAVERHKVCDPAPKEDRKQQKGIFGWLSDCFSLLDQKTCPLYSRLGFRRGISFDMHEWGYERDLKLDLFAAQRGRGREGRDLGKRPRQLL